LARGVQLDLDEVDCASRRPAGKPNAYALATPPSAVERWGWARCWIRFIEQLTRDATLDAARATTHH